MLRRPGVSAIGSLVPVVTPVALLAGLFAVASKGAVVSDTWLALVSGREIVQHGLPSTEHLTSLAAGHQWVDQQWLGQLVLYAAARVGGTGLVVAICGAALLFAFGLAAAEAHRKGASPGTILAFFALAFAAAPWAAQARPQALALPLFVLTLWLLLRDVDCRRRSTLWVLPILCLWANVHGSVVLGAAIVCAYGLQVLVRRGWRPAATALAVFAPASVLASPYALQLPGYYRLMLFDRPFAREVVEWQRTTPSGTTAIFFVLAAGVAVIAAYRRRRIGVVEWLALAITLAAALSAIRNIMWFGIAVLAVVPPLATRKTSPAMTGWGATAFAAAALAAVVAAVGWASIRPYDTSSGDRAAAVVRAEVGGGTVLADFGVADWLLWEVPSLRGRVAFDARPELLTPREFTGVLRFAREDQGWESFAAGYSVAVTGPKLAEALARTRQWQRRFDDHTLVVLRRVTTSVGTD